VPSIRAVVKRILPEPVLERYRRRRALRTYLKELSYELWDRQIRVELDDLEERIAARRHGMYGRLVRDVLERTDLVLQELDRKIEGTSARHGNQLRALAGDVASLKAEVADLQSRLALDSDVRPAGKH
jgi:hypothetical protein